MRFLISFILLTALTGGSFHPVHAENASPEEELFLVAQKAFEDGFYDVAMRYIEQFLKQYPQTDRRIQAQLLLGQCYFFKKQYLKAYEVFQGLLGENEYKDATLFWLGETYFKGSDYKQAEKHYQQVIDEFPESAYLPQTLYSLGWTYFEQGKFTEAKQLFQQLVQKFPVHQLSEDAVFKIGECEQQMGNYGVAVEYFERYILKFPLSTRHAEAYFYIAEGYYYQQDFLTAITYYAKAAEIAYDPKLAFMAKVSMGWSYLKLEKFDLSQKYFDEARALAADKGIESEDILLGQASLYAAMGEHAKAEAAYAELIQKFPNSPRIIEARIGKANVDYILQKYDQAVEEYQWLIQKYQNQPERQEVVEKAYYGLAWTHLKAGRLDEAVKTFETIMNSASSKTVKISALTQIGDAYHETGNLEKAVETYDRILKNYPDSLYTDYVQFRQAVALLKMNKLEPATLSFQSLQANFPGSKYLSDVEYYLGVAYYKKEDWIQAVRHLEIYLKEAPLGKSFSGEAHYILGLSYFNQKQFDQALQTFQQVLKHFPDQLESVQGSELNIALCYYNLGQAPEALRRLKEVVDKYPATDVAQDALLKIADHYLESGQWPLAVSHYQQFLEKFPGSDRAAVVHYEMGEAYEALEQPEEALKHYKLIDEQAGRELYAKAKLAIADIFSQKASPQAAIETYTTIANSVPDFQRDAYVKIADILEDQKQYRQAIEAYEHALSAEKGMSNVPAAELQFHIGDSYEILNETDKAVESYLKIPYLYPQEKNWVVKAYLRAARIFENKEDWEEAKIIYDKVAAFDTEESKYAAERIDWLNQHILQNPSRQ